MLLLTERIERPKLSDHEISRIRKYLPSKYELRSRVTTEKLFHNNEIISLYDKIEKKVTLTIKKRLRGGFSVTQFRNFNTPEIHEFEDMDWMIHSIDEKIDIGYKRITWDDFFKNVYGKGTENKSEYVKNNWSDFSDNRLNLCKGALNQKWFDIFQYKKFMEHIDRHYLIASQTADNISSVFEIFPIKDEWFYIRMMVQGVPSFYKCDRWKGLLKCIKDIL